MKKFSKYIKKGIDQSLESVPFHSKAPVKRLLMANDKILPNSNVHIAVHMIDKLPKNIPDYGELHKHKYDEINLLVSQGSKLKYEFNFEDEIYEVSSPATIFIPKNTLHSFKVISGKGIYICIIFQGRYQASK